MGAPIYCFRIRFRLGDRVSLNSAAAELQLSGSAEAQERVSLRSAERDTPIEHARFLALIGEGYGAETEAFDSGRRWRAVLQRALARLNVGADFGERSPSGIATEHGLKYLEQQHQRRVLNDTPGVMVFECEPWPLFVRTEAKGVVGKQGERVVEAIAAASRIGVTISDPERLAYDLYSASFSESSADARFAMLMMAVETLIRPADRHASVVRHVDRLIQETRESGLREGEIRSIVGTLEWLHQESIGQAGRRLARRLGDRQYMGEKPVQFFTRSYELRSRLVHGHFPRPTREEVDSRAAQLELFVSHLLSGDLLDEYDAEGARPGGPA